MRTPIAFRRGNKIIHVTSDGIPVKEETFKSINQAKKQSFHIQRAQGPLGVGLVQVKA